MEVDARHLQVEAIPVQTVAVGTEPPQPKMPLDLKRYYEYFIERSQTLREQLEKLDKEGWKVIFPEGEQGARTNLDNNTIYLGSDSNNAAALTHELGHAIAGLDDSEIPKEYGACVDRLLLFEGTAILNNIIIREEILAKGGCDIGIMGATFKYLDNPFMNIYNDFKNGTTKRKEAEKRLGELLRKQKISTGEETYEQYYGEFCKTHCS